MKKILFILLFLPFLGNSQTWPVRYGSTDPSGAPSASATNLYFNTSTNNLWLWEPSPSSMWRKQPKSFDQITGCAAPAYTPTPRQSTFAVNSCTPKPELYQWTGSAWALLNPEALYTAGVGITLSGTAPDITISAYDISQKDTIYVLVSGQSNAMGWTIPYQGDTTGNNSVQAWNGTSWVRAKIGQLPFRCAANYPALSTVWGSNNFAFHFCKKLAEEKKAVVRMVLVSFDGNPIVNWIPSSSTNYSAIKTTIAASGVTKINYFLWHQGETDETQTFAFYKTQWETLKSQLRAESWFPLSTPIIVGGLLRQDQGGIQYEQDENLQTFDYDRDPLVGYASSAGLTSNGIDSYHFSGSALVTLGRRYYEVSQSLPRMTFANGLSYIIPPGYQKVIWVNPAANASEGRVGDPNKPVRRLQAALDSLYNLNGLNDSLNLIVLMPGFYTDNVDAQLTGQLTARGKFVTINFMPGARFKFNTYYTNYTENCFLKLIGDVNVDDKRNVSIGLGSANFRMYIKGTKFATSNIGAYTLEGPYIYRQVDTLIQRGSSYDNNLHFRQSWTDDFKYVSVGGGGSGAGAGTLYSFSYSDPIYDHSFSCIIENFEPTSRYGMIWRTGFGGGYTTKRSNYTFKINRVTGNSNIAADTYHRGVIELGYGNTYDTCRFTYNFGTIESGRGLYSIQSGTHNNSTIYINVDNVRSYYACVYLSSTTFNNSTVVIRGNFTSVTEPAVLFQNCAFNNTQIVLEGNFTTLGTNMDAIRISNCSGNSVTIKNSKVTATGTGKSINSTTSNQGVEIINSQLNTTVGSNIIPVGNYTLSGSPQTNAFFAGSKAINLAGGTTAERASTPTEGDIRKNTTDHSIEFWNGSAWLALFSNPVSYTNAAAPNNCIFYSTTLSKLAYKDPGGTVNPLY